MKYISLSICLIASLLVGSHLAQAADPYAGAKFKNTGMIHVTTPNSAKDEVNLTHRRSGKIFVIASGKVEIVPAGNYKLQVKMEEEIYNGKVTVLPAERTDVVVGFGKLKVKGSRSAIVQVVDKKRGRLVAEFPAKQSQLLPRGLYDVKVHLNGSELERPNVLVVGSKTSVLEINP